MSNAYNFFICFYPSNETNQPHSGRATHYPRNSGIVTLDDENAQHIADCVRKGIKPQLFAQAWHYKGSGRFNVGFKPPRSATTQAPASPGRIGLLALLEDSE